MLRASVVVAALALALSGVELFLHLAGPGYEEQFLMPDRVRGWRLRPGFAGWTADENTLWIRINQDGMRDRERPRAKPPGVLRVAILGDSYMQAMSVPDVDTFAARLEHALSACARSSGRPVEVLNFGVSGYGTVQEWLTYRDHARAYSPDVVVVAFYSGNDVHSNSPEAAADTAPFLAWNGQAWQLDNSFVNHMARDTGWTSFRDGVTRRLRTAMLPYRAYGQFLDWRAGSGEPAGVQPPWREDLDASRPPGDDVELEESWRATEAALLHIAGDARQSGAEPWIVTLTTPQQVDPDVNRRRSYADAMGVADLYYSERRLAAFGTAHGIGVVNLAPPMADHAARTQTFLHGGLSRLVPKGSGHWNVAGHELAAQLTASRLCGDSAAIAAHRGTH